MAEGAVIPGTSEHREVAQGGWCAYDGDDWPCPAVVAERWATATGDSPPPPALDPAVIDALEWLIECLPLSVQRAANRPHHPLRETHGQDHPDRTCPICAIHNAWTIMRRAGMATDRDVERSPAEQIAFKEAVEDHFGVSILQDADGNVTGHI